MPADAGGARTPLPLQTGPWSGFSFVAEPLDRADALREVGAGLQLSPNALRVLDALDLWPRLQAVSVPSERVELRERRHLGRCHAGLARFAAHIDLQQHLQRPQGGRALRRQPLGHFQAIDGMHPGEVFGDGPRLVALDGTDEMPLERQDRERLDLSHAFLYVVLAEDPLPAGKGRAHGFRRLSFRHRHDRHRTGRTPGTNLGLGHARAQRLEPAAQKFLAARRIRYNRHSEAILEV